MAEIENLEAVIKQIRDRMSEAKNVSVLVGFSAKYAIFIHENMEPVTLGEHKPRPSGIGWYWGPPDYGPKFLEAPARELAPELGAMVRHALKNKQTMLQALMQAGLRLQREAQERVPVESGNLRASAFTKPG